MTITWYGYACFRIETREAVLVVDPFSKGIGLTPPRFQADVILISHGHPNHANIAAIGGTPLVIQGPGEYETRGVTVRGIPSYHDPRQGKDRGLNTIYRIEADGISIAHLGDFGERTLREETLEALGDVDVLLIPVGGTDTIGAEDAAGIVRQLEPRVVIPMHYRLPGLTVTLDPADRFLATYGGREPQRLAKLTLKPKDLPDTDTRIVLLSTE